MKICEQKLKSGTQLGKNSSDTDGIIIMFDKSSEKSMRHITEWIQSIYRLKDASVPIVLVGNKRSTTEKIVVTSEQGRALAAQYDMSYHDTSTETGDGARAMINDLMS